MDASQFAWVQQDLINSSSMKYKVISLHPPPLMGDNIFEDATIDRFMQHIRGRCGIFWSLASIRSLEYQSDGIYFKWGWWK